METTNNTPRVNKSDLMKSAWTMFKKNECPTFAEALKKAWKAFKLKVRMQVGVVAFQYKKLSGDIRNAMGTLHKPQMSYIVKGSQRKRAADCIRYFDVDKKAFRSFNIASLI